MHNGSSTDIRSDSIMDLPARLASRRAEPEAVRLALSRVGLESRAEQLPSTLRGRAADLGAGFGYLAAELLARCPGITALDLYEAEQRALELARLNLAATCSRASLGYHWHDVTRGLPQGYDVVISNPPFHTPSGNSNAQIGRQFVAAAAAALRPGGELWLVANRHLPYETVLGANFSTVRTVIQRAGFKVVAAVR